MRLPKPLLFGLCGLVGAVVGAAAVAEPLWRWLSPPVAEPVRPEPLRVTASPGISLYQGGANRFPVKIAREGFTGPVTVAVEGLPQGVSAAAVRVAAEASEGEIEITAEPDAAPGRTVVHVVAMAADSGTAVAAAGCDADVRVLFVEQPAAAIRLAVSPRLQVVQGTANVFTVRIVRDWFDGAVTVRSQELPKDVNIEPVVLPSNADVAEIRVVAGKAAAPGRQPIRLVGEAAGIAPSLPAVLDLEVQPRAVPKVDVIFVLDATGSMKFAIDGIRQGIATFAAGLETADIDALVGLVAFRDQFESGEGVDVVRFGGKVLTSDYREFARSVGTLEAKGGGDAAESSADAVALAAGQGFRPDAVKALVLVTDAPPKVPDRENRSLDAVVTGLRRHGIDQLHLVVRPADRETYEQLQAASPGRFFDVTTVSDGGVSFARILPDVSREIAAATLAGLPPPDLSPAEKPMPPPPTARPAADPPRPVPPPVIEAVQSRRAFAGESLWKLIAAVGVSQGAVAAAICLALFAGQRLYLKRGLPALHEAVPVLAGGYVAGLIGGGMAQLLQVPQLLDVEAFKAVAGACGPWAKIPAWAVLGGLAGFGVGRIIPNLGGWRGLVGGALGGGVGAGGFLAATAALGSAAGEFAGRVSGAGLLGLGMGLMVALAEAALREASLVIHYGQRESRTVSLGPSPVSLGGDARCTVFVRSAPPHALVYTMDRGRVYMARGPGGRPTAVGPGHEETLCGVRVVVRGRSGGPPETAPSASSGTASASPAVEPQERVLWLRFASGVRLRLVPGTILEAADLPGAESRSASGPVAQVVAKPGDERVLGLRNLTGIAWKAITVGGVDVVVPAGKSVSLAVGMRIFMGKAQGTVES